MADSLPRYLVLGRPNTTTFFQYVLAKGTNHRRMQLSSPVVASATNFTRLEVVRAPNSVGQDLVHIKSAYNNKYLVLESESSNFLVVGADDIEEDRSKWSCTLFKVASGANGSSFLLQSKGAQHSVQISSSCLSIVRNSTQAYWFTVTNMTSLATLPKYVAFKGNNDFYMSSQYRRLRNRLYFGSSSILDSTVHHEVIPLSNGDIHLKSIHFGQLWRKSNPEWIWCDTNDTNDQDTRFRPVLLSNQDKSIALLNLGNNKYCMRWVKGGQPRLVDTLTASATKVEPLATLTVEEAIREREITNIRYNIEDARTYNVVISEDSGSVQQYATNEGPNTIVQRLGFTYKSTTQKTFTTSHSWKLAYSSKMKVTVIPKLVEGEVRLDATYEGNVEWSETTETSTGIESDVYVPVPPMSKVPVTLLVGRGNIDVPFSYTQHDILPDGRNISTNFDDGLYTGRNTVIDYTVGKPIPLSAAELEEARKEKLLELEEDLPPPASE